MSRNAKIGIAALVLLWLMRADAAEGIRNRIGDVFKG